VSLPGIWQARWRRPSPPGRNSAGFRQQQILLGLPGQSAFGASVQRELVGATVRLNAGAGRFPVRCGSPVSGGVCRECCSVGSVDGVWCGGGSAGGGVWFRERGDRVRGCYHDDGVADRGSGAVVVRSVYRYPTIGTGLGGSAAGDHQRGLGWWAGDPVARVRLRGPG
jgi:hypothetical protein